MPPQSCDVIDVSTMPASVEEMSNVPKPVLKDNVDCGVNVDDATACSSTSQQEDCALTTTLGHGGDSCLEASSPVDSGLAKALGTAITVNERNEDPRTPRVCAVASPKDARPHGSTSDTTKKKWWMPATATQDQAGACDHPHAPVLAQKQCWWCNTPLMPKETWYFAADCTFCSRGCRSNRLAMTDDHPRVAQHRNKPAQNLTCRPAGPTRPDQAKSDGPEMATITEGQTAPSTKPSTTAVGCTATRQPSPLRAAPAPTSGMAKRKSSGSLRSWFGL